MTQVQNMSEAFEQEDLDLNTRCDDLQQELDDTQAGAGLQNDGSYSATGSANYIQAATSLHDADSKLDAQVKVNADGLAQEIIDRSSADVDHLARFNRIYAGVGLDTVLLVLTDFLNQLSLLSLCKLQCFWFIYQNCF